MLNCGTTAALESDKRALRMMQGMDPATTADVPLAARAQAPKPPPPEYDGSEHAADGLFSLIVLIINKLCLLSLLVSV